MGFWGIGIYASKTGANVGTLWRSANSAGTNFIFTVRHRFPLQSSDTLKTPQHIPLYHYTDIDDLVNHLPHSTVLVGVELVDTAKSLDTFSHPERACYLLGAEDYGLSSKILSRCHCVVRIEGFTKCINVAVAGSIICYDRNLKRRKNAIPKG